MIDVTFTSKDGRTGTKSFHSYAHYVQWTQTFTKSLLRYRATRNLREFERYELPFMARLRLFFGGFHG
jgi:hypothetical protein